jgi:hypothetical protein
LIEIRVSREDFLKRTVLGDVEPELGFMPSAFNIIISIIIICQNLHVYHQNLLAV